jgi:hypothetical protein
LSNFILTDAEGVGLTKPLNELGGGFRDIDAKDISAGAFVTYYVVADVNSMPNEDSVTVKISISPSGSTFVVNSSEKILNMEGTEVSAKHTVAQTTFSVIQDRSFSTPGNDFSKGALKFSVWAHGKDKLTLQYADFENDFSSYSGDLASYSGGKLVIVRVKDNAVVASGDQSTGSIKFNPGVTVEPGQSETFLVKLL